MRYYNEKIETMSRDEMTALQSARLVDVVKRTYEGAPYFRAKMDAAGLKPEDIKGIEDIAKLPFTTKADLRANYPFGCFALPISEIARVHASSGTTGKLTVVGLTNRDIDDWAECAARALVWRDAARMISCTSPTVTDCSRAGSGCITAPRSWAPSPSPRPRATR